MGDILPHKCGIDLFGAIHTAKHSLSLVIIGRKGWDNTGERLARETRGVVRLESVTDRQMVALYRKCSLLVSASLIEGFGLPVLEAAFFATPIVCSNIASYREILGDCAVYFPGLDLRFGH